ncbi:hypothetical protein [Paenibacillus maysiensis]|uniref:hypothetical protein n=1 Tax=Paenibacillus maysiensis TaxID=1155954 RepID=UPI0004726D07|nr:hypothetical protein [Paenibacillus maysiensis]
MNSFTLFRRTIAVACTVVLLLSGCTPAKDEEHEKSSVESTQVGPSDKHEKECSNVTIDYASLAKWNGVTYRASYENDNSNLHKGEKVGAILYRMADYACPGYVMKDGDATLLEIGTELYEVKGYAQSARLFAGDILYEATHNPSAKTINDLLDISGKIAVVRFVSGNDGTELKDFTPQAIATFAEAYPKLNYVPFDQMYKQTNSLAGNSYYLQIEMKDGSTRNLAYHIKYKAFYPAGYATPELTQLVEEQRKRIYAQ